MKLPKFAKAASPSIIKIAQDVEPHEVFARIHGAFDTSFITESLGERPAERYAVMGFGPDHIISGRGNSLVIDGVGYQVLNPYAALRDLMPSPISSHVFAGGLVGYLGYEAVNFFDPALSVKEHRDFEPFMFGMYTDSLVHDSCTGELFYVTCGKDRSA